MGYGHVNPSLYIHPAAPKLSLGGPDRDEKIDRLEAEMCSMGQDADEVGIEILHHFAPGIYAREMRVPAGRLITSKVHRFENLSILSRGRMVLYQDDGTVVEVVAGMHVVAPAGARRVAWVLEDSVWTVFHATTNTNPDEIEAQVVAPSRAEYLKFSAAADKELSWVG